MYSDNYFAIENDGKVIIEKGNISSNYYLDVTDNGVVINNGELIINGGIISSSQDEANIIYNESTLTINDGIVYSNVGKAIYNQNGSVNINGGTIYSINSNAIFSINDSDNSLTITIVEEGKDLTACNPQIYTNKEAAIHVQNLGESSTNFNMRNGLVYSSDGAIILQNNVSGTISGGLIDSKGQCALTVGNGSNITISGGTFLSRAVNQPAIRVYSTENTCPSSFIMEWPKGKDWQGTEPLLYSECTSKACLAADRYSSENNYSQLKISGGYLYSNYQEFYYEDHENSDVLLNFTDFGGFYSNRCQLFYLNSTHYLYNESGDSSIDVVTIKGNEAVPLGDNHIPVTLIFHEVNSKDNSLESISPQKTIYINYKIYNPNIVDMPSGGTQSYNFSDFSW